MENQQLCNFKVTFFFLLEEMELYEHGRCAVTKI